jgi:hypothetical protein
MRKENKHLVSRGRRRKRGRERKESDKQKTI